VITVDVRYTNKGEAHTAGRLLGLLEDGRLVRGFVSDDLSVLWKNVNPESTAIGTKRSRTAE